MVTVIRFSVVIPAFNEEQYLPRLLRSLHQAREAYEGGADAVELIVADNQSTDGTAAVALAYQCLVIPVEKRCIAAARNGGAAAARGQVLAFIDADSEVHPETFGAIDEILATGKVAGGATGVRFERQAMAITVLSFVLSAMAWFFGVPKTYAGVVFCRREDLEQLGGYDEQRLFAEDADFLFRLRRLARARGQTLNTRRVAPALFSMRKFDQHGDWHYLPAICGVVWDHFRGRSHAARRYWYDVR